ncbi:hypothetical protein DFH09DRAFT_1330420 [Mycena vulgaris]|nr:hypothetical protein DFH09DRAFT_1330420 [Mycena vulgaris]
MLYHIIIIPPSPVLDAESVPELWLCATVIIIHLPIPRPAYNLSRTGPTTYALAVCTLAALTLAPAMSCTNPSQGSKATDLQAQKPT